ncbi:flagellar hook protein FlgE [Pseudomonas syringae pv. actinidiae]|uniref:Flagellar hook protein FlgE n=2 Tax=Pseudomonas syringae group TaxID=136849 RepID=A0A0K8M520_PSESF|nr:flagellar hook protein FlgE [Pseudomonas syringae]EPN61077.1 flagellar hook protein FlgE [Pseudomonas syringae pv. actinidiae ICMP 19079]EPN78193.1 flagellar hook protein FlgE [Pseudomonas syringae pv. actinidiae ICMP 19101]OZI85016.1 flagellar hook protein FlgE [Pseudomonas avellanae]AKT29825.1 flagellar hook protein FlgE [Pseudomonas syringae pv. actinidiae ICMP 18884]AOE56285.1 flagellar biosynthesis protein FlgE [Pseudomonas syringae pv. actinidiae ICMP 18708]
MSFNIGLSGLYAANKSLDVTGNNIANVATTGFKSSRAEFADQYAQSIRGTSGQTNVGSGVSTAAVSQQFSQGNLTTGTANSLDLAINGNGFFMLSNNGEKLYTRAGAFHTDKEGFVVNSAGMKLQGYNVDANGSVVTGALSDLKVDSSNLEPKATTAITNVANLNSTTALPTLTTFDATDTKSYNMKYSTPTYDTQGNAHTLDQYFVKTGTNTWSMYSLMDGRSIANPATTTADKNDLTFDSSGNLVVAAPGTVPTDSANITFNTDGTFTVANWVPGVQTGTGTTTSWVANGATGSSIKLNMAGITQTASVSGLITQDQDGYATGQLSAMSVDSTGNLFATYTNGKSQVIGQTSLTNFANVQGLAQAGGTNWRETFASGVPVSGTPQSGTLGSITGQALEESNVDLTMELVNLIKAQSNYQANAKTISTQSTIMQTTIQMT